MADKLEQARIAAAISQGRVAKTRRTETAPDIKAPSARSKANFGPVQQIRELNDFIGRKLNQIANLTRRGRVEQAAKVAAIVATKRVRLDSLRAELAAMTPDQAIDPVVTPKSRLKAVPKRRTYKTWSQSDRNSPLSHRQRINARFK